MTTKQTTRPAALGSSPLGQTALLPPRLLTKEQVLSALRAEIAAASLTEVSKKYELAPQQLSDILAGRAGLSKRVLSQLRLRLVEYYERIAKGAKA